MIETKVCCDHCGMVLFSNSIYDNAMIETPGSHFEVNLCSNCVEKLDEIIEDFINKGDNYQRFYI